MSNIQNTVVTIKCISSFKRNIYLPKSQRNFSSKVSSVCVEFIIFTCFTLTCVTNPYEEDLTWLTHLKLLYVFSCHFAMIYWCSWPSLIQIINFTLKTLKSHFKTLYGFWGGHQKSIKNHKSNFQKCCVNRLCGNRSLVWILV